MLHTKCRFISLSGFREDFKKSANQKQELPVGRCLLMDRDEMSTLYRGPAIDASYQVSVLLAKWFQRRGNFKISHTETRVVCVAAMFVNGSELNEQIL